MQSAGTLFFNVTTFRALATTLSDPAYDRLVWRPDEFGSICSLVFGIAAVVGHLVPSTGTLLDLSAANWTTAAGAACFLGCATAGLRPH